MSTDNPLKKKPTGGRNPTAGCTDTSSLSVVAHNNKWFETLRAAYALRGHALHRTDAADGLVTYWAERWSLVRDLPTLHDVEVFLAQIGGRV